MKFLWSIIKSAVKRSVRLQFKLKNDSTGTFAKIKFEVFGEKIFNQRVYLPLDKDGNLKFDELIQI